MKTVRGRLRLACLLVAGAALTVTMTGQASDAADYHTSYATKEAACSAGNLIKWTNQGISGPGFNCTLGDSRSAGSGLAAYESACVIDGTNVNDLVVFDLGNNPTHFSVALPGKEWVSMYPCTPVQGLDGTN